MYVSGNALLVPSCVMVHIHVVSVMVHIHVRMHLRTSIVSLLYVSSQKAYLYIVLRQKELRISIFVMGVASLYILHLKGGAYLYILYCLFAIEPFHAPYLFSNSCCLFAICLSSPKCIPCLKMCILQCSFAKEHYKRDDILQKRPIILRSLLLTLWQM